jgi:hypothetical protein
MAGLTDSLLQLTQPSKHCFRRYEINRTFLTFLCRRKRIYGALQCGLHIIDTSGYKTFIYLSA